jgi:hypothetical protein
MLDFSTFKAVGFVVEWRAESVCKSYETQPILAALACLLLFGITARRRNWRTMLGLAVLFLALNGGVLACGGGNSGGGGTGSPGTTSGTYAISITGNSGAITAAGMVTLTVQ